MQDCLRKPLFASNNVTISLTFDRKSIDPSTRFNLTNFLFVAVLKFSTFVKHFRRVIACCTEEYADDTRCAHTLSDVTRGEQEMTLACNVLEAQSTRDSKAGIRAKSPCYSFHSSNTLILNDDSRERARLRVHRNADLRSSVVRIWKSSVSLCHSSCVSGSCRGYHGNWAKTTLKSHGSANGLILRIRNLIRRSRRRIDAAKDRDRFHDSATTPTETVKSGIYRRVHVEWAGSCADGLCQECTNSYFDIGSDIRGNGACHHRSWTRRTNEIKNDSQ
ncbi:hypothetical protein DBV15_01755 [Temnothorax longispinosus]|uniref:Uncharacterized protein n=1 Tax=Temnothorax longispinosus TaxID=300112 RepID=A0A4S2KRV2_9HYME|nr:hypothetical protein DBV15_01755 [Temnothorax longispinosus]